jgi:hypothetical protein
VSTGIVKALICFDDLSALANIASASSKQLPQVLEHPVNALNSLNFLTPLAMARSKSDSRTALQIHRYIAIFGANENDSQILM